MAAFHCLRLVPRRAALKAGVCVCVCFCLYKRKSLDTLNARLFFVVKSASRQGDSVTTNTVIVSLLYVHVCNQNCGDVKILPRPRELGDFS